MENTDKTFRFFPSNKWQWKAVRDTYQDFFKQGLSFWTNQNYDIPYETTAKVLGGLIVIESILKGSLHARFDFLNKFIAQLGGLIVLGVLLGFILLMKEWLEARGDFKQYLAFSTYARFILLPISLLGGLSDQFGGLVSLVAVLWILYAFYKKFELVFSRFIILVGIVWGIVFLAVLASFLAGMKLFL